MKTDLKLLWGIFLVFLKISPVTFGGGYAMIPAIERAVVREKKWLKAEDVTDVFAVAGSVPGAVAINAATFIGYRIAGISGAIVAMMGVLVPTFLIVVAISLSFFYLKDNPKMTAAFKGIRPAIVALITFAGYKIWKTAVFDKTTFVTVCVTVFFLLVLHVHPVFIIMCGGAAGVAFVNVKEKLGYATRLDEPKTEEVPDIHYFMGAGI